MLRLSYGRKFRAFQRGPAGGFTMVELVVAIALVTALSLVLGRLLLSGVAAFNYATARKQALRQARIGLAAISRELRQINGTSGILLATGQSIHFVNVDNEQVTLAYADGRVLRNDVPLARGVTSFMLRYFNQQGVELTQPIQDPSEIRAIRVHIQVTVEGKQVELETEVRPRNL